VQFVDVQRGRDGVRAVLGPWSKWLRGASHVASVSTDHFVVTPVDPVEGSKSVTQFSCHCGHQAHGPLLTPLPTPLPVQRALNRGSINLRLPRRQEAHSGVRIFTLLLLSGLLRIHSGGGVAPPLCRNRVRRRVSEQIPGPILPSTHSNSLMTGAPRPQPSVSCPGLANPTPGFTAHRSGPCARVSDY